jgi:hypothetical protein
MRRSFTIALCVLVAVGALGMTTERGYALFGKCGKNGCPPSSGAAARPAPTKTSPTKGTKPVHNNPRLTVNVGALPVPNFWWQRPNGQRVLMCDDRAHDRATAKFQYKIAAARARIKIGLIEGTKKALTTCSSAPGFLKKSCCAAVKNIAVEKCKEGVLREALADQECTFKPVRCRLFPRPVACIAAKKSEEIRAQCCTWLAPQGREDLLAYCDIAAQEVQDQSGACTFVEATSPSAETPIVGLPAAPPASEPINATPVEQVITVIPQEPSGEIPNQVTE